jgi:hypothetical protein
MTGRACALVLLAIAACASAEKRTNAPPAPTSDTWAKLTWEERHDVMTFAVLPNMAKTFQTFRGTTYPEMTCATCHGPDPEAAGYAMPRGLAPLDPDRLPDANAPDPRIARTAKFMREQVTPEMADLLGVERARFSCFRCHPRAGSTATNAAGRGP